MSKKAVVIHKFNLDARPKPLVVCDPSKSRTQQHFKDECDINKILAKYKKTGVVTHVKRARALFGDFSELAPHAENMDKVAKATQAFEALPAELRNEFKNSIPGFFKYISDPKNKDQCVKWGIFDPPKVEVPPAAGGTDGGGMPPPKSEPPKGGEGKAP